MMWVFLAILARFFWACCNVTDQYLSRCLKNDGAMPLLILQNIAALATAGVMMSIAGIPQNIDNVSLMWIGLGVIANALGVFPYLRALQIDEARHVVPLQEMTPIAVIIMSSLFMGEAMTLHQLTGAAVVIACGFGFVWDFNYGKPKLRVLMLIAVCSFFFAFCQIVYRLAGQRIESVDVTILFLLGVGISGIIMALILRRDVGKLCDAIVLSKGRILGWEALNQVFWGLSILVFTAAMTQAPTAGHVAALSGTQPVLVTVISAALGAFSLRHFPKMTWDHDTKIKVALLIVMCGGAVLLSI